MVCKTVYTGSTPVVASISSSSTVQFSVRYSYDLTKHREMNEMSTVVVLNASFEPLGVVPLRRAMVYLVRERAVIVEAVPGEVFRSAAAEFPVPKVVRFRKMIRVPYRYRPQPWSRHGVLRRDRNICAFCGKHATSIDHIVPQSRGGLNEWLNTVAACSPCNGKKANRTPGEARMPLRYTPREVSTRDTLLVAIASTGADLVALGLAA